MDGEARWRECGVVWCGVVQHPSVRFQDRIHHAILHSTTPQVVAAKKAAKIIRARAKSLVDLRKLHEREAAQLEDKLKLERLAALKRAAPEDEELEAAKNELQSLDDDLNKLHQREMTALNILLERKREMQVGQGNEVGD